MRLKRLGTTALRKALPYASVHNLQISCTKKQACWRAITNAARFQYTTNKLSVRTSLHWHLLKISNASLLKINCEINSSCSRVMGTILWRAPSCDVHHRLPDYLFIFSYVGLRDLHFCFERYFFMIEQCKQPAFVAIISDLPLHSVANFVFWGNTCKFWLFVSSFGFFSLKNGNLVFSTFFDPFNF